MKSQHEAAFMACAEVFATLSYSKRLKVGCVLVKDGAIIATGWNGMAPGEDNTCEDADGNTKSDCYHAEDNALKKLTRSTLSAEGSTCFVTHACCKICSDRLIAAGIREVIYKEAYRDTKGLDKLKQAGIVTRLFNHSKEI